MNRLPSLIALCFIYTLTSCNPSPEPLGQAKQKELPIPPLKSMSSMLYGIAVDSMEVKQELIKRNQFLSDLLSPYNVSAAQLDKLAKKSKDVFDIRKMRSGKAFTTISGKNNNLEYFVYEKNKTKYVVYDLRDSIHVYEAQKPIEIRTREASGVIASSLYATIQKNNLDIELASKLEDLYAWSVDFFHTHKGDWFRVIYDEQYVDGESVGISEIYAADFHHGGKDFYAISFEKDAHLKDFYDEDGNSLRKEFLKAPLKYSRISSGFSYRRFHPILKRYRSHLGVDFAAPTGTPIRSIGDGSVTARSYSRGNGRFVKIRHNGVYATQYLHMSKFAKGIKIGSAVKQGDIIGYVGSTGLATGPHLCFRFWKNGKQVNPRSIKSPPTAPIPCELYDDYYEHKEEMIARLSQIPLETLVVMKAD